MSKLRDMKKRFLPLSMLLITMVLAQASLVANAAGDQGKYTPRSSTKATISSFMKSIRANQETGLIDPALLIAGQQSAQSTSRETLLDWNYAGPDNFGGPTKAIVYDNDGNVLIGTASGDIYKTTNGGITFGMIANLGCPISCMILDAEGNILIGTGEGREAQKENGLSVLGYGTSFIGKGIYKMDSDELTFVQIASTIPTATNGWGFVNEITIANDKVYAATAAGIMVSDDNCVTWTNTLAGNFRSIKSNSDGDVLAADTTNVFLSSDGAAFVNVTDDIAVNSNPKIIAMSPSDPDYMYIAYLEGSAGSYTTGDIYFTEDGGLSWGIAMAGTSLYSIMGADANVDGFMVVYPEYPTKLLIGSDDLWLFEDITGQGVNSYRPTKISEYNTYEYTAIAWNRYIYLHQGIQNIVFDPEDCNTFFIGTNGGVYKGEYYEQTYSYKSGNRYFLTDDEHTSATRIMNVGIGGNTKILAGSIDHGTIMLVADENINNVTTGTAIFPNPDPQTNANQQFGFFTKDYAGGPCAISTINPDMLFVSGTGALSTPLHRSESNGEDYDLTNYQSSDSPVITNANAFKTPYAMFENYNDANNPVDTIKAPIRSIKYVGDTVFAYSLQAGHPVEHIITEEPPHDSDHQDVEGNYAWMPGDTICDIHDPLSTLLVCAIEGKLYMTRGALIFNKTTEWLEISEIAGIPTAVAICGEGDMAMVGTAEGYLYKVTGLNNAYTAAQASIDSADCVVTFTQLTGFSNQAITSISINPTDDNNILLTLGNYGNTNYAYISNNGGSSFTAATGLPQAPAYSCLIEKSSGLYIVGTEYGIYVSEDGTGWEKSGDISCPIMDLKQAVQENRETMVDVLYDEMGEPTYIYYEGIFNEGMIYAATYGAGILSCNTFKEGSEVGIDENDMEVSISQVNIYPNPARGNAQISFNLSENAQVSYQIYDLSGRMMVSHDLGTYNQGEHVVSFNTENLTSGTYIISLQAGSKMNTAKFLVY